MAVSGGRWEIAVRAVASMVVVVVLASVLVRTTRAAAPSAVARIAPDGLGTTWVYDDLTNGRSSGQSTYQVIGRAVLGSGAIASIVRQHYDDFAGTGEPLTDDDYRGVAGGQLVEYGVRTAATFTSFSPPLPDLRASAGPFHYSGQQVDPTATVRLDGQVFPTAAIDAGGRHYTGCTDARTTRVAAEPSGATTRQVADSWSCPDIGVVRSTTTVSSGTAASTVVEEDLVRRTGPGPQVGRPPPLSPVEATASPAPTSAVDLTRLAWSDTVNQGVNFAPAASAGLEAVQGEDGTVTALDTHTGAVRWRVALPGPPVAPVTIAGGYVLVADTARRLWALDGQTGSAAWSAGFGDIVSAVPVAATGRTGPVVLVPTEDRVVHALDLADGAERWQASRPALVRDPIAVSGDIAVIGDDAGGLQGRDITDGRLRWTARLQGQRAAPIVTTADAVVATDTAGYVEALDASDGHARWYRQFNATVYVAPGASPSVVAVADGSVIRVLDLRTGHTRLTLPDRAAVPAVVLGDAVVVATTGGRVDEFALGDGRLEGSVSLPRPNDGTRVGVDFPVVVTGETVVVTVSVQPPSPWPATSELAFPFTGGALDQGASGVRFVGQLRGVPSPPPWPPVRVGNDLVLVGDNGGVYDVGARVRVLQPPGSGFPPFVTTDGDSVYTEKGSDLVAVDPNSGAVRWTQKIGSSLPTSIPVADGDVLIVPITGAGLVGLDRRTGHPIWVNKISDTVGSSSPLLLPGGDVVYAVGGISRLDGTTGQVRWTVPGIDTIGPLAVSGTTVFAVGGPPTGPGVDLYAVDSTSGRVRWKQPVGLAAYVGPAVGPGAVVVATGTALDAFDPVSGAPLWSVPVPSGFAGSPVVKDGRVYVDETGSEENASLPDHRLTALDLTTGRFLGAFQPSGSGFGKDAFTSLGGALVVPAVGDQGAALYVLSPVAAP